MDDIHTGGCACGSVRYRVRGQPIVATVCHCEFCRRRLASAFAVLASFPEQAVEVEGDLAEYLHRSDESGRWLKIRFCAKCGTTVCHTSEFRPGACTIAAGTFDDATWFTINRHIWTRSKLPWVTVPQGMDSFEKGPPPPAGKP